MKPPFNFLKIKFYLRQDRKLATVVAVDNGRTALPGDRRRSDKQDPGDRETVLAHQGGAVVPDVKTLDEEIRPETH